MSPFPFRSHLWPHNCLFSATAASAATDILPLSRDFSGEDAFPQQGMKEVGIEQVIEQGDDTPPEVKEANEAMKGTLEVKVGGNPVGLDDLGPIIINEDGTMRRIANWALLTPKEKAATRAQAPAVLSVPHHLVSSCVWRSILYLTLPAVREPSQLQLCASLENAVSRNN